MGRLSSYVNQDGCHNCGHVFVKYEYDDEREYFCAHGSTKRPECGSAAMGECFSFRFERVRDKETGKRMYSDKEYYRLNSAWNKWSKSREVKAWGKCDKWTKMVDKS